MKRDPQREAALARITSHARATHAAALAGEEGRRLSVMLECLSGEREPEAISPNRHVHPRMYMPGLSARPYWPANLFPVAGLLRRRFPLIRQEAAHLMANPGLFGIAPAEAHVGDSRVDGGRLNGTWRVWYLQRHFERQPHTAAQTPIALRSLDGCRVSREAMFSLLGPGAHVTLHSDGLNFVITLYMPLIAPPGAWINFDRTPREWREGDCFAADSTFLHESINATPLWRAILIVDMWHPDLTELEMRVLAEVIPRADAVMRGRLAAGG